jgi:AraC-like DNA-binding protein/quercetin dioxygenase-like cupin family protein
MSRKRHTAADEPHFLVRTLAADFRDGDRISPHEHDWGQLIYAASGVVTVWTERGSWVLPPHWALWAPAGVRHGLRFTGAASLRTLYLRPDVKPPAPHSAVVTVSPLLRELILRAVDLRMLDAREPTHRAIVDLIVYEFSASSVSPVNLPLPRSERLRRIAEDLAQRPRDRETHASLAKRFGVGVRTLERSFITETGLSLGQWRRQARVMRALQQLGAGESVKRVAAETGYRTPSAFIAAFRAALNITPGRYFDSGRSSHRQRWPGRRDA